MIKINLLGDDTAVDHTGILFIGGYVASLVLLLALGFFMYQAVISEIDEKTAEKSNLEAELAQLQETTKEVKELEKKRQDLSSKLAVIATLKRNKVGPVRVLDDLNNAIPERAWLKSIREKGGVLRIEGIALDNQTIAIFMKDLEQSDYYQTIDLVETRQVIKSGVTMKEFTLNAKISYAGKIKLAVDGKVKQPGGKKTKSASAGNAILSEIEAEKRVS